MLLLFGVINNKVDLLKESYVVNQRFEVIATMKAVGTSTMAIVLTANKSLKLTLDRSFLPLSLQSVAVKRSLAKRWL